jgi:hypothetical protein
MRALGFALGVSVLACSSAVRPPVEPAARPPGQSDAASSAPDADSARGVSIRIPARVGEFRMANRHDYEDPGLGVQLRYHGPDSLIADVYVYPGPGFDGKCDSACALDHFAREVEQFRTDFPEMIRRRYYDSIAVVTESALAPGPGRPWLVGRHLQLAVKREGRAARSDFYLFYVPMYRVKVRLTYAPTSGRSQAIEGFMRDLMPRLVGSAAPTPSR